MARLREVDIKLVDEVDFHDPNNGKAVKTSVITIQAPSRKHRRATRLKCAYVKAWNEYVKGVASVFTEEQKEAERERLKKEADKIKSQDPEESEKEEKKDPEDVIETLLACFDEDEMNGIYDALQELLADGCGFLPGDIPLNKTVFDKLSYEDTEYILGRYLSDFLLSSQRTKMNGKK